MSKKKRDLELERKKLIRIGQNLLEFAADPDEIKFMQKQVELLKMVDYSGLEIRTESFRRELDFLELRPLPSEKKSRDNVPINGCPFLPCNDSSPHCKKCGYHHYDRESLN